MKLTDLNRWKKYPNGSLKRYLIIIAVILIVLIIIGVIFGNPRGEKIGWQNIQLGSVLPKPQSKRMQLTSNNADYLSTEITGISENEFYEYIRWCREDKGFAIDEESYGDYFYAYNQEGYYLSLHYVDYSNIMRITLEAPIPLKSITIPEYALKVGLPIPESKMGSFDWKNVDKFRLYVGNTSVDDLIEYKEKCIEAGFNTEIYEYETNYSGKNADGHYVSVEYKGYNTMILTFKLSEDYENNEKKNSSNKEIEEQETVGSNKIVVTMSEDEFKGLQYTEAEKLLREMGFSSFEYDTFTAWEPDEEDGTVMSISIRDWFFGSGSFKKGDSFDAEDAIVEITYYVQEEDEPEEEILTKKNCEELKLILKLKDPSDPSIKEFAKAYGGRTIEFNGCVSAMQNHGNYDTRFDILINAGDFDPEVFYGPNFRLTDVNSTDLGIDNLWLDHELSVGTNVHVVAKLGKYSPDTTIYEIEPIQITVRE